MRFPSLLVACLALAAAGASTAQAGQGTLMIHCNQAKDAEVQVDSGKIAAKIEVLNSNGAVVEAMKAGDIYYLPASGTVGIRFSTPPLFPLQVPITLRTKTGKAHLTVSGGAIYSKVTVKMDSIIGGTISQASDGSINIR